MRSAAELATFKYEALLQITVKCALTKNDADNTVWIALGHSSKEDIEFLYPGDVCVSIARLPYTQLVALPRHFCPTTNNILDRYIGCIDDPATDEPILRGHYYLVFVKGRFAYVVDNYIENDVGTIEPMSCLKWIE